MLDIKNKHILITQLRLFDFAGSETVTLELAEEFSRRGSRVSIATTGFGEPIVQEFEKIKNVSLYGIDDLKLREVCDEYPVDIAWVHHQQIPEFLLRNPRDTRFIFHHMSPYANIEAPLFWSIEDKIADAILCNSKETVNEYVEKKLLSMSDERVRVLNNPAPVGFYSKKNTESKLNSILVVSNHVPDEVYDALKTLRNDGIEVEIFGAHDNVYRRILPVDINKYDVIVSIGKTVQYSLLGRKPVYCYDRFGGPGYLGDDNFTKAEELNFSGRGFEKKTANMIASELIDGFTVANKFANSYPDDTMDRFNLEMRIDEVLGVVMAREHSRKLVDIAEIESYLLIMPSLLSSFLGSAHQSKRNSKEIKNKIDAYRNEIKYLSHQYKDSQAENSQLKGRISNITASASYRLGNALAAPIRAVKSFIAHDYSQQAHSIVTRFYGAPNPKNGTKITIVVANAVGPSSSTFIRILSPLVEAGGYSIEILDGVDYRKISKDSAVCIVQRVALKNSDIAESLINLLDKHKIPLITDNDDAFCNLSTSHPEYELLAPRSEALDKLMMNAQVNLFSTEALARLYEEKLGIKNAKVLKNSLDERFWSKWKEKDLSMSNSEPLKLLYMGTPTHHSDFEMIKSALDRINEEMPGSFTLSVMGVSKDLKEESWIEAMNIPNNLYPAFVEWFSEQGPFDVGFSPLEDNEFNENKSDIKCLDYLAIGALPVVSDTLAYKNPELTGLIKRVTNTKEDWYKAISELIEERESIRQDTERISRGYEYLSSQRSVVVTAEDLDEVIKSTVRRGKK